MYLYPLPLSPQRSRLTPLPLLPSCKDAHRAHHKTTKPDRQNRQRAVSHLLPPLHTMCVCGVRAHVPTRDRSFLEASDTFAPERHKTTLLLLLMALNRESEETKPTKRRHIPLFEKRGHSMHRSGPLSPSGLCEREIRGTRKGLNLGSSAAAWPTLRREVVERKMPSPFFPSIGGGRGENTA